MTPTVEGRRSRDTRPSSKLAPPPITTTMPDIHEATSRTSSTPSTDRTLPGIALLALAGLGAASCGATSGSGTPVEPAAIDAATVGASIDAGVAWLVAHQSEDGRWDADGFAEAAGTELDGAGNPTHDVGVTGLALLALLGDGHTLESGAHAESVRTGAEWLLEQQDADTGLIGDQVSHAFLYDHAIATFALASLEAQTSTPALRDGVERGVQLISRARNPYRVWRYSFPPNGQNDSSVTGWMILALHSAKASDVSTDEEAFRDAIEWFDDMTDASGRVGYREPGSSSSRITGRNDQYPTVGEAMSALALLCRSLHGQTTESEPRMAEHAEILLKALPERSEDGLTNDMYYWFYGSYAMRAIGGERWQVWRSKMLPVALSTQRGDGDAAGSWDPDGPWGYYGGRVYSTALMTLALQSDRGEASVVAEL